MGAAAGDQTPPILQVNVAFLSVLPVMEYPEAHVYTTVSDTLYEAARLPVELFPDAAGGELHPVSGRRIICNIENMWLHGLHGHCALL